MSKIQGRLNWNDIEKISIGWLKAYNSEQFSKGWFKAEVIRAAAPQNLYGFFVCHEIASFILYTVWRLLGRS